jgi:predicted transcriptional regulator
MRTVIFSIRTFDPALDDFARAWKTGRSEDAARIGFASWDLMHKALSPKRLDIVRVMTAAGPLSLREIARRVGRDFKSVHSDVRLLVESGVIDKTADGQLIFPYDRIHVEFEIPAAA